MKYSDFVDYSKLDPFKKEIAKFLKPTFKNILPLGIRVVEPSIGEPTVLLEFLNDNFYLAFKSDGVGTKNMIIKQMFKKKKSLDLKKLYSWIGIDLLAMNANDLICLGAVPIALSDEVAAGNSAWFEEKDKIKGLLLGLRKGCNQTGATIPCGETPVLKNIICSDAVNITGSMIGIIRPKAKVILGENLSEGDIIYGLASSGVHANGLTLARKIVEKLPRGYFTPLGKSIIGEILLKPTRIYVKPVLEMLNSGGQIHYMSNITGSAFKKIARAKKPFTYLIENLPQKPKIFSFLQTQGKINEREAYQTWNMGVGFVIFAPSNQEKKIATVCQKHKIALYKLGRVQKGPKKVVVKPLGIVYDCSKNN